MSEETVKVVTKTAADKIWDEIKNKSIDMFSLPNQEVHMHCSPTPVEPSKLYLNYKASSLVASLEDCLGSKYKVDLNGKYITVSKA